MSNDELYDDDLTNLMERIMSGLQNRTEPLGELDQALNQLVNTNTIQGKAADNMKAYIGEVHLTLIQTLQLLLNNFEMAFGKYAKGYLEVDSSADFKLVREDLEAHINNLTAHRSDFSSLGDQLLAISNEAEDILWLGGAGGYHLYTVANEMDAMKKTASDLKDNWDKYEESDPGFAQIQDLIAQTKSLIQSTLKVPRGYSYSPGSFSNLVSQGFMAAFQANSDYANDPANQKAFQKDWKSINKDYVADQKRIQEAKLAKEKEKNRWNGFFTLAGSLVAGAALIGVEFFTAGLATPLVITAGAFIASDTYEGFDQLRTGKNKGDNFLRWVAEKGSKAVTGSEIAGDFVYNAADLAVGIYSGGAEAKAFELAKVGTTVVNASKASQIFDRVSLGYGVASVVPVDTKGDTITSIVENKVYQSSYSEWHNVALSSALSHGMDISGDVHSAKNTAENVVEIDTRDMIADISKKNVQNIANVFASQAKQRSNFAKVVN
jgi:hypothetical protein